MELFKSLAQKLKKKKENKMQDNGQSIPFRVLIKQNYIVDGA
jgi:hypothetical protein